MDEGPKKTPTPEPKKAPVALPDEPLEELDENAPISFLEHARALASVAAAILITIGVTVFIGNMAIPPGGGTPDIREIPGGVQSVIDSLFGGAKPETGYPRIRVDRVGIDLLMVKGDGKTPPAKFEAFTYPGADYLLTGDEKGGGNSYVYGHARNGMFWNLHNTKIGDVVMVDYGGGKVLRYRIAEIHPKVDWKDLQWLQPTSDDRLTLQTCNGWRDEDPRFIVVAHRIPDQTALSH
jgi:LPXTG-site transpeptidase (sortase) family protein